MRTILIVEDEKSVRDSIRMILEYEKYRTFWRRERRKALDAVHSNTIDGVLLEYQDGPRNGRHRGNWGDQTHERRLARGDDLRARDILRRRAVGDETRRLDICGT